MITLLCVGKLKERYLRDAVAEYQKRIGGYDKLSIIEIDEYRLPDHPSESQIQKGLLEEGKCILQKIPQSAFVFCMCIDGTQRSSESFSKQISTLQISGKSNLVFVIGSSFGLSKEIIARADEKLSLSKMTFPHQLARVILLEQIYRAFQISHGGRYHK